MSSDESEPGKRKRPAARAATPADEAASAGDERAAAEKPRRPVVRAERSPSGNEKATRRISARAVLKKRPKARPGRAQHAKAPQPVVAAGVTSLEQASAAPALNANDASHAAAEHEDVERDLALLLHDIEGADGDAEARNRAADAIGRIAARLHPGTPAVASDDDSLLGGARQLFSADYYLKRWARVAMRGRSEQVDDFGLDATYEARVQPLLDLLYERYFRVQIEGVEHVPAQGGALLVCNHGGTLPWDGVMLKTALRHAHPSRHALRWLTDDFVFHSPFLGPFLNRIGAVRACPENAERLLERQELLAVFPEGVKGIGKPYRDRYQLQRFGRGGHVKLALRMRVPLIPVAIIGAEESYPLLHKVRPFSKLLGVPFIPVTPLFPWLGPLGLMPLPSRWRIVVGEPMHELRDLSARAAEDSVVVNDLNEQLRGKVQGLLKQGLDARGPGAFL